MDDLRTNPKMRDAIRSIEETRDRGYDLASRFNSYQQPRVQVAKRAALHLAETEFFEIAEELKVALAALGFPLIIEVG